MGWLWSSAAAPADAAAPTPQPQTTSTKQAPPPATTPSQPLTPAQLAEQDLQAALAEFDAENKASAPKNPIFRRTPRAPTEGAPSSATPETELNVEDSLYPTTMSCRDAFDAAFYCQSLGGQFNAVYRYGGMQSCSDHWKSFWFCMSSKSYTGQREDMIKEHYRKKALKYKVGPSSEDVWEGREKKMEWGEAFSEGVEELLPGESDEEWNVRERKRREGRNGGTV
jgi:hypothetical protein